jgi:hypothetical protein
MNKSEIYNFICNNKFKIFNSKNKDARLASFLKINEIFLPISITVKNVYDYLTDSNGRYCPICNNENKFLGFLPGYSKFCSKKCLYKWRSNNMMGSNNNIHKLSPIALKEMGKKNSKHIKEKIANGTWTPNVTNSWCYSKIKVKLLRNGVNEIIKCRSSWEAFFQLKNPNCLYEKIRIPYFYKNNFHNYIIDFVDIDNKIIYEIKPNSEKLKERNKIKFKAAQKWAHNNNFSFIIIDNDWLKENYDDNLLIGQIDEVKLKKLLKQFNEN